MDSYWQAIRQAIVPFPILALLLTVPYVAVQYHGVGDHYLYICDVEQAYRDESEAALFAWNGYSQICPVQE